MMRKLLTVAAVAALVLTGCGGAGDPVASGTPATPTESEEPMGFTNPVYAHNFPDPQILNTDDGYIAIATNGNGMNVQVLTSPDMVDWSQSVDAMPTLASWTSAGKVWAPEAIEWDDGTYRMYYTTKAPDPQWQCIGVATSEQAAGPYEDTSEEPIICEVEEGGSIDASPFIASDGSKWLFWKNDGNAIGVDTWIKVAKLSDDGRSIEGETKNLFKQTEDWEGNLVEGPAVVEVDGVFHMLYSANDYGSEDYAMGHAVADAPDGTWRKDPKPVMMANDVAAGPGHCQFVEANGQWWIAYHAWVPGEVGDEVSGRQLWLSKVTFDGESIEVQEPTVEHPDKP